MATPIRTIRIPDEKWNPALDKARSEGRDLSEVIREFLDDYIDEASE